MRQAREPDRVLSGPIYGAGCKEQARRALRINIQINSHINFERTTFGACVVRNPPKKKRDQETWSRVRRGGKTYLSFFLCHSNYTSVGAAGATGAIGATGATGAAWLLPKEALLPPNDARDPGPPCPRK